MQEEFNRENTEEILQNEESSRFDGIQPEAEAELIERERQSAAKKKLRFAASHVGWATALLVGAWMVTLVVASVIAGFGGASGVAFYNKYLLILNEVTLSVGIAVALLVLLSVPRVVLHKEKITAGGFMKILAMCFGAGYVGNLIGTFMLGIWNGVTGNSVGDELVTLLDGMDPFVMFISVGILAPILEELFFRKLLIDRLRVFGETTAILITAILFALFHMSASQLIYAFTIGVLLGYFYCRTGNYPLTVLIHAIFNTVSGVIPVLFLPKISAFETAMAELEASIPADAAIDQMAEMMMPVLQEYGLALGLYILYALVIFAFNLTGVVFLIRNFKKFRERKGEFSLPAKVTAKTVCKTGGMIVCAVLLVFLTVTSLFS